MKANKHHFYASLMGIGILLMGILSSRFMTLRENRIEVGHPVNFITVMKTSWVLIAVLCISIILALLVTKKIKRDLLIIPILGYLTFAISFYTLTEYARIETSEFTSAGRITLNSGFWLYYIGLMILIFNNISKKEKSTPGKSLIFILLILFYLIFMYQGNLMDSIGIIKEINSRSDQFLSALLEHLVLTFSAGFSGLLFGVFISYWGYRNSKIKKVVSFISSSAQVIPTLSLLGLIMIPLTLLATQFPILEKLGLGGIGFFPAYLVLTLYTLLPITSSALSGFEGISKDVLLAAKAMGLNSKEICFKVELPLATPSIISGFRVALVQGTGNAILAGLVGGGGLGTLLFLGLAQSASDLVIASALMVVLISLVLNKFLYLIQSIIMMKRGHL